MKAFFCFLSSSIVCLGTVFPDTHPLAAEINSYIEENPLEPRIPKMMQKINATSMEYNKQGYGFYEQRRYKEAITKFEQAVNADKGNSFAWYNMACCHALIGNSAQAAESLKKAIWDSFWAIQLMVDSDLDGIRKVDIGAHDLYRTKGGGETYTLLPDGRAKEDDMSQFTRADGYFCIIGDVVFLYIIVPVFQHPEFGEMGGNDHAYAMPFREFVTTPP